MAEAVTDGTAERQALRQLVSVTLMHLSRTAGLPALPGVATAALAIARDPNSEVEDLTKIVRTDTGLTARLLRVANSPGYGRRRQAQSIHEAAITVGLRQTCSILVAVCARQLYAAPGPHTEVLWNHSLAAAVAAEELARATRRVRPDLAFLPGLFHDVGRVAFQMADASSFGVIQELVASGVGPSTVLEREWYEFDHAQAGAILTEDWGLSQEQWDAIQWHHDPTRAEAGRDLAALINAADHMAYTIGYGSQAEPPPDVSTKSLGLSDEDEAACADRTREMFEIQKQIIG